MLTIPIKAKNLLKRIFYKMSLVLIQKVLKIMIISMTKKRLKKVDLIVTLVIMLTVHLQLLLIMELKSVRVVIAMK